jgi:hypothetical protein
MGPFAYRLPYRMNNPAALLLPAMLLVHLGLPIVVFLSFWLGERGGQRPITNLGENGSKIVVGNATRL